MWRWQVGGGSFRMSRLGEDWQVSGYAVSKLTRQLIAHTSFVLMCALPALLPGQTVPTVGSMDRVGKLRFHAEEIYSPWSIAASASYAGFHQLTDSPKEWGEGGNAYGKRVASAAGYSAIHATLAVGLDTTLHQDPRYFRSTSSGFWRRTGHAVRGTILTRTDSGGETISTWRLGSAYGAAFLSNEWYPDRLNTVSQGVMQGTLRLGFDLAANLGAEFWPDVKAKMFGKKR
jgi:hypothetical protein